MEVLWVNYELNIIYSPDPCIGELIGLPDKDFYRMIAEAKKRISNREHVLDRWEEWELPDTDPKKMGLLLMSRAKTKEEKELVTKYMSLYKGETK